MNRQPVAARGFVEVPRAKMDTFLKSLGFSQMEMVPSRVEHELVYARCHDKDPRLVIKVYTSIAASSSVTREKGADAIRVVLVASSPGLLNVGVWKGRRVHRVGRVFDRIRERAREAYRVANRMVLMPRCKECGFYRYGGTGTCANRECKTRHQ